MGQNESTAREFIAQGERKNNFDIKPLNPSSARGVSSNTQVPNSIDENINLQKYPTTYGKSLQNKNNKYFADNSSTTAEHRRLFSNKENMRTNEKGRNFTQNPGQLITRNESNKENISYQARADENIPGRPHQLLKNDSQSTGYVQSKKIKEICIGMNTTTKPLESNYFTLGDESAQFVATLDDEKKSENSVHSFVKESLFAIKSSLNKPNHDSELRSDPKEKLDLYRPFSTHSLQDKASNDNNHNINNIREGNKSEQNEFNKYFQYRAESKRAAAHYNDQKDKFLENLKFSPKTKYLNQEKQANETVNRKPDVQNIMSRAPVLEEKTFERPNYSGPAINNECKKGLFENESRRVSLSYISIESCNNNNNIQGNFEFEDRSEFLENMHHQDHANRNLETVIGSSRQNYGNLTTDYPKIGAYHQPNRSGNLPSSNIEKATVNNSFTTKNDNGNANNMHWKNNGSMRNAKQGNSYLASDMVSKTFDNQVSLPHKSKKNVDLGDERRRSKSRSQNRVAQPQAKSIKSIADYGNNSKKTNSKSKRSNSKSKQVNKTESEIFKLRVREESSNSEIFDSDQERISIIPLSNYHANKKSFPNFHEDSFLLHSKSVIHQYDGDSEEEEDSKSRKISNQDCKKKALRSRSRPQRAVPQQRNEATPKEMNRERSTSILRARVSSHNDDIPKRSPALPVSDNHSACNKGHLENMHLNQPNNPITYPFVINSPYMQPSPFEAAKQLGQANYYLQNQNQNQSSGLSSPMSTLPSPVQNLLSVQSPINNYLMGVNPYQNLQNPQLDLYNAHQQAMYYNYHMMNNQMSSPHYYMGPAQLFPPPHYMVNGMGQPVNGNNQLKAHYGPFMPNSPPPIIINNNLVNPDAKIQNNSIVNESERQNENLNDTRRNTKIQENYADNFTSSRRKREKTGSKDIELGPLNEADLQSGHKFKHYEEPLNINRLSLKDEAVIMASPDINSNLMIIKGCRNNDLSYRAPVNTTAVNFEVLEEKERKFNNSVVKSKSKRSFEFEKFSNQSPEEAQIIFSSNKACRIINQSLISPSCEINSPLHNKSNKNSEKDLSKKLEVTEFLECNTKARQVENPLNNIYANPKEPQPLSEHQKKIFSFKFGPTGKKTSLGEARYEEVQNFMSQESFSQRDTVRSETRNQNIGMGKTNMVENSYESNPAAVGLNVSPNWKFQGDMLTSAKPQEERRMTTLSSNDCFEKMTVGPSVDKVRMKLNTKEEETYETSTSTRNGLAENFTTCITESSSSLKLDSRKALKMEFNFGFAQTEGGNKDTKTLADFFNEKKKNQLEKRNFSKKKDAASCDQNKLEKAVEKGKGIQSLNPNFAATTSEELNFARHTVSAIGQTQNAPQTKKLTKEELLKNRKEMLEYGRSLKRQILGEEDQGLNNGKRLSHFEIKDVNMSRGGSVSSLKKREPDPALIERLANGVKTKLSKKEMAALTAKNYANLPEVKDRLKDREKKEKVREDLILRKEKVKEMDKKLRDRKKRDKSNV